MKREAMLICPKMDNAGNSLEAVRKHLVKELCKAFGGATVSEAQGAWVDPNSGELYDEPVWQIVSAVDVDDLIAEMKLRSLAHWLCDAAQQLAVYLRQASGEVEIVTPERVPMAA